MRRFIESERFADSGGGDGNPIPPRRSWLVRSLRILLLGTVAAVPIVPAAFLLMPMPRGADGITLCLPLIGPLQQFAEDMDPELDEIVHIHERVHANQCHRLGALDYARTYIQDEGMIALEAEAFCAEARTLEIRGRNTGPWVSRIIETLYHEYPHDEALTYADVTRIVGAWCPRPDDRSRIMAHP
jgi:hypothetical protein